MASATDPAPPDGQGLEGRGTDTPSSRIGRLIEWWRTRHQGTTPEDRRRVIDALLATAGGTRTGRFWAMQGLAIVIATMGMSADSAAVVIGAMLVAPLMTPIMAVATALALGWPRRALAPLAGVVLASGASVALAWLLHSLIASPTVTDEILARTSPDLRDGLVALAAGAAGALGTARQDVSAALPGVAVAVALVPPLAAIGACLELGRSDLAGGAFLLFATNLVAIVTAGILVLLWCGFVPARLIARGRPAVLGGTAATLLALVVVGVPLTLRTMAAAETAEVNRAVTEVVRDWLDTQPELELTDLGVGDTTIRVDVTGPHEPTDVAGLTRRLRGIVGDDATTTVRWSIRSTADPDEIDPEPEPGKEQPPDTEPEQDDLLVIRSVIDAWAAEQAGIDIAGVAIGDESVLVDVVGERPPSTVGSLSAAITEAANRAITVEVRFSERIIIDEEPRVDRRATIAAAVRRVLDDADDAVDAVRFTENEAGDVERIVVDLSGSEPPSRDAVVEAVSTALAELDGFDDDPTIVVRFTERRLVEPTEPVEPESDDSDDSGDADDSGEAADSGVGSA